MAEPLMDAATRCPACDTALSVTGAQLQAAGGWVRCGRCGEVYDATPTLAEAPSQAGATADPPTAAGDEAAGGAPPVAPAPAEEATAADATPSAAQLQAEAADADDLPAFARPPVERPWQRPAARPALAVAAVLLALALAAQAAVHWRDSLAAFRPALRPALEALCLAAGCHVGPLRRLEGVGIEGSEWSAGPSGAVAQLVLVVTNRGRLPVALPWVELTLTEVNGGLLARRALAPGDLGATSTTLAPASETVLRATLAVDGPPPAGYTVELFHP